MTNETSSKSLNKTISNLKSTVKEQEERILELEKEKEELNRKLLVNK